MAIPRDWDEDSPADDDFVSQYPTNARARRDAVREIFEQDHVAAETQHQGKHKAVRMRSGTLPSAASDEGVLGVQFRPATGRHELRYRDDEGNLTWLSRDGDALQEGAFRPVGVDSDAHLIDREAGDDRYLREFGGDISGALTFDNDVPIRGRGTGGTAREMMKTRDDNNLQIGEDGTPFGLRLRSADNIIAVIDGSSNTLIHTGNLPIESAKVEPGEHILALQRKLHDTAVASFTDSNIVLRVLALADGELTFRIEITTNNATHPAEWRLRRNGSAIHTNATASTSFVVQSVNASCEAGDWFTFDFRLQSSGGVASVRRASVRSRLPSHLVTTTYMKDFFGVEEEPV